ncbi:MAG TPA: chorismate mutase [Firmicutes bacterium]|uniref:chorismate mutase n=1 Tax=Gelria sp. Kuro-4 TaxID=2796927 RepID=UPI0019B3CC63|nr:chorismate mutase [Gelria sp. Kuro-4]BCV25287.1 chorismate mutase [Gelria sp. Kuro-4]HHV56516.1 chorismate mutase [Bacillota bacterium]
MALRGVRGATTCAANTAEAILEATKELLTELVKRNGLAVPDIAAAIFSLTDDLDAAFPATAARTLGWQEVPLFCCREIPVPGSIPRCLRILLLVNSERPQNAFSFVYLRGARALRPDIAACESEDRE